MSDFPYERSLRASFRSFLHHLLRLEQATSHTGGHERDHVTIIRIVREREWSSKDDKRLIHYRGLQGNTLVSTKTLATAYSAQK